MVLACSAFLTDLSAISFSTIRLCPPLVVTEKDIDLLVQTLADALNEDII